LAELHLGTSEEQKEEEDSNTEQQGEKDSNIFTKEGFKVVLRSLKTMPKLTMLDMQLPHVNTLQIDDIGTLWLFDLGTGERGAQFVVQNLKNLT
jgi:hypothetical protein